LKKVEKEEVQKNSVKKDKNLDRLFYFGEARDQILNQLEADVKLLQSCNLMDYSLLIGTHKVDNPNYVFPSMFLYLLHIK
jgi:hypothetical protein